jgi:hypothetical protein
VTPGEPWLVSGKKFDLASIDPRSTHAAPGHKAETTSALDALSEEERRHDFLWRVYQGVPAAGEVGIFNRSHYEDVLIVRVHRWVAESVWRARYDAINDFERHLVEAGTTMVKLWFHISPKEQARRLQARLGDPTKRWKFQRRRPRGVQALARVHGRRRGDAASHVDDGCTLVRRARGPQVVSELGGEPDPHRDPHGDGSEASRAKRSRPHRDP